MGMRLIAAIESRIAAEESLFRRQLMKEDVARLRKLLDLKAAAKSRDEFMRDGRHIGWTQGDFRTHEVESTLAPFLEAVFDGDETATERLWGPFEADRLEKLTGCLSTRPRL